MANCQIQGTQYCTRRDCLYLRMQSLLVSYNLITLLSLDGFFFCQPAKEHSVWQMRARMGVVFVRESAYICAQNRQKLFDSVCVRLFCTLNIRGFSAAQFSHSKFMNAFQLEQTNIKIIKTGMERLHDLNSRSKYWIFLYFIAFISDCYDLFMKRILI